MNWKDKRPRAAVELEVWLRERAKETFGVGRDSEDVLTQMAAIIQHLDARVGLLEAELIARLKGNENR